MRLSTDRLIIKPLNPEEAREFVYAVAENSSLDDLVIPPDMITPAHISYLTDEFYPRLKKQRVNFLFYTTWLIIRKETNLLTGQFLFNGLPDPSGKVEAQFELHPQERKKGYMHEALSKITDWCRNDGRVKTLIAETDPEMEEPNAFLEKFGFVRDEEQPGYIMWQYRLS